MFLHGSITDFAFKEDQIEKIKSNISHLLSESVDFDFFFLNKLIKLKTISNKKTPVLNSCEKFKTTDDVDDDITKMDHINEMSLDSKECTSGSRKFFFVFIN